MKTKRRTIEVSEKDLINFIKLLVSLPIEKEIYDKQPKEWKRREKGTGTGQKETGIFSCRADFVGLDFAMEGAAADAEQLGRLGHVGFGQLKGLLDEVFLHRFQIEIGTGG